MGRRRYRGKGLDVWHQVGPGQSIIQHGPGEQLAVVIVNGAFPKGLARSLYHAAVDLALDDHGVDLGAAVIHRQVAQQVDMAVVWVHADHRHVGAEGIGKVGRVIEGGGLQPGLHAFGHVPSDVGHQSNFLDGLAVVRGSPDEEIAVLVIDVGLGGLQQVGCQGDSLVLNLAGAQGQRAAAHHGGTAAVGSPAHGRGVGVTVNDLHVVYRNAQLLGKNLGKGGFFALSVGRSTNEDVHLAGGVEADRGTFPQAAAEAHGARHLGGAQAANFAVATYAYAGVAAVLPSVGLVMPQLVVVDVLQRQVKDSLVVAAVIGQANGYIMAILELGNKVHPAHFHRVLTHFRRQQVHQPLQQEGGLRPTGAPIGLHRRRIGKTTVDIRLDVGDIVGPRVHQAVKDGGNSRRCRGEIGAHAGINHASDPGHSALAVGSHFHVFDMVAAVGGGYIALRAGLGPFYGAAQLHCAEGSDHLPRIDRNLGAEPTAHLRGDDPNLVFRNAGYQAGNEAGNVGILCGVPDGQFPHGRNVAGDGGTGLHGVGNQFLLDDGVPHHHIGIGEGIVGVSAGSHPVKGLVARGILMQLGCALLQRSLGVDNSGQGLVVHVNQFDGVLRLVAIRCHHHGHRVAHIANYILGQGRVGHGLDIGVGNYPGTGHRIQHPFRVGAGIDGYHARGRGSGGSIYAIDASMAVGATQNGGVDQACQLDVIRIGSLTGNQPGVFPAANTGAE